MVMWKKIAIVTLVCQQTNAFNVGSRPRISPTKLYLDPVAQVDQVPHAVEAVGAVGVLASVAGFFGFKKNKDKSAAGAGTTSEPEPEPEAVDVSIPYDAAAMLAFNEWNAVVESDDESEESVVEFDESVFKKFKAIYETKAVAQVSLKKAIRDTDTILAKAEKDFLSLK